ncbi:hypothetical protein E1B28_012857 [Marasmius oreades]|uniref:Uncharacterized protein n=1 Tax=Marasmius oreades TaxID=181124 RepID=A0A9P7RSZ8_9AGAR|nr:uncharacterized protein E1B28_012857 [Marasmius oreades]KAG7088912.1 hypothetical protein E1B28_012857 [Marasmius oreades]
MSFVGCKDFKLVGGVYNHVHGNQNHTVVHTTNNTRDSNNNYNTTNYGDRCVTNNGGRIIMNPGEEHRPRGKTKKKHRSVAQGVGYGYQDSSPQISTQNLEQQPQQLRLDQPQAQFPSPPGGYGGFPQWNQHQQPYPCAAGSATEPSYFPLHPPLPFGHWPSPTMHANAPYHHPNPSNPSYSLVNPPIPTASAPPNLYPYAGPAPGYDSHRPYSSTYLSPQSQTGMGSHTQAQIHHSPPYDGSHVQSQNQNWNGNGNWYNSLPLQEHQHHPSSGAPSLVPVDNAPYPRSAWSAPPHDHAQVQVQGPQGVSASAGNELNGHGFPKPESQGGAFARKKMDPWMNPKNPFSMASANVDGRDVSNSLPSSTGTERASGEAEDGKEEEEDLKVKANDREGV